ncbi:MAG: helix-turn-helix domain-containing protein [Alphaproteobacteria bacterium]|nr:helix-turn-helix domain-containing protein [Alphaproteobacteria bacterium]
MQNPRAIDVFVFHNVNLVDVAGPVQAFDDAWIDGHHAYTLRYLSVNGKPVRASCGLTLAVDASLANRTPDADLLVPGGSGIDPLLDNEVVLATIRAQAQAQRAGGPRLISVCSGALLLASAGVLNGRPATTHWSRGKQVQELFPQVHWELDTIFTQSGNIYTSAGVSTGMDLALSIIQQDCGNPAALAVAQELVVYRRRGGGQSQYSNLLQAQFSLEAPLVRLAETVADNPTGNWSLENLAAEANMSNRTLSRKFSTSLGVSPVQFVELTRLETARALLSEGVPKKQVAARSGFGDLQRMRRSFQRHLGVSASEYLQRFGPIVQEPDRPSQTAS